MDLCTFENAKACHKIEIYKTDRIAKKMESQRRVDNISEK